MGTGLSSSSLLTGSAAAACTYDGPPTYSNGWPQYGDWTQSAIGAGGMTNGVAIAPSNACVVYLWTDVGGLWRSDDHGDTWYLIDNAMKVRGMSVDPRNEDVVVEARNDGIYRTTYAPDRSAWTKVQSMSFSGNGTHRKAGNVISRKPDNDDVLVAAGQEDTIYRSTDNGQSWSALSNAPSLYFTDIRYDPANPSHIYACAQSVNDSTTTELWKSTNGGDNWTQLQSGSGSSPKLIEFDPSTSAIYGVWPGGSGSYLQRSTDGGWSWNDFTSGLPDSLKHELFTILVHDGNLYVFDVDRSNSYGKPEIYQLPAGGSSWSQYADVAASDIDETGWFWEDGGSFLVAGIAGVAEVVIDESDNSTWHLAATGAYFKSTDSGSTWAYSSKGMAEKVPFDIYTDPRNSDLNAVIADTKYMKLKDDGETWDFHREEMSSYSLARMSVAQSNPDYMVATSANYVLYTGQIFISTDNGQTWEFSDMTNIPATSTDVPSYYDNGNKHLDAPVGVSIDPTDQNHVVVAIGGADGGAYESTDGGDTWTDIGLSGHFHYLFWAGFDQIALSGDGSMVTAPSISGASPQYYDPSSGTWSEAFNTGGASAFQAVADPNQDGRLFVCVVEDDQSAGGVWETTDGGESWEQIITDGASYLTIDPNDSDRMAVAREQSAPLVTFDGGSNWEATDSTLPSAQESPNQPLAFSGDNLVSGSAGSTFYWNNVGTGSGGGSTNLLTNPGFEDGSTGWSLSGSSSISSDAHSGSNALAQSSDGDYAEQSVGNQLSTDTTYDLSAWGKLGTADTDNPIVGIKFYDSDYNTLKDKSVTFTESSYTEKTSQVTAPSSFNTAVVYVWKGGANTTFTVDDFELSGNSGGGGSTNEMSNPGFEDGSTDWSLSGSSSISSDAHSGSNALAQSSDGDYAEQSVGNQLSTDTTYDLSAWGKLGTADTDNPIVGIKFYDSDYNTLKDKSITFTESSYTEKTVQATAPSSFNTAVVYVWKGGANTTFTVDDFELNEV